VSGLVVEYVPTAELRTYHRNPRHGDTKKIAESLTVNGQYRAVAVNRGTHTGRANEVLAGNHTLLAARDLGWETVAATFVDVDDDQAARIVLADNRTADVADYDDRLLAELLSDLPDVDGTGYDPGDLDEIVKALGDGPAVELGAVAPDEFPEFGADIATEHCCPKCGYEWSGASH
jgi:ParB-like chromosome segregation protein Spo0J